MTRIKICGITNIEDALAAAHAGADALGFVFYAPSPRYVCLDDAKAILAELPPFVTSVGLFVDASAEFMAQALAELPLDILQFHGDESESECSRWGRPYVKAIRMREGTDLVEVCQTYHSSHGILLDAFVDGVPGGTGQTFNWNAIQHNLSKPIILAGGLNPRNVAAAIQTVRPWAVDVSGGVEASKGRKDHALIKDFITGVHRVSERA